MKITKQNASKMLVSKNRRASDEEENPTGANSLGYFSSHQAIETVVVHLDEEIKEPSYYRAVIQKLVELNECDNVKFFVNTPGGDLAACRALCTAINATPASTTAILIGQASSAGSFITLACDEIVLTPASSFLCHAAKYGNQGKAGDMRAYVDFSTEYLERFYREAYAGFLTEEEIEQVLDGKEMHMHAEEIEERLILRAAYFKGLEEEEVGEHPAEGPKYDPSEVSFKPVLSDKQGYSGVYEKEDETEMYYGAND